MMMGLYVTKASRNGPTALIDGDLIVYAAAHSADGSAWALDHDGVELTWQYKKDAKKYCEDNFLDDGELYQVWNPLPEHYVYDNIDKAMTYILEELNTDEFEVYLTGKDNYRKELTDTYKAHRKDQRKPAHFDTAMEYIQNMWDAVIVNGMEADDMLGIRQMEGIDGRDNLDDPLPTCICTKDKDLDMIPGWHFNFGRGDLYSVSHADARRFFYKQLITGDRADNIWGIPGMGDKRADKFLDSIPEEEWHDAILDLYVQHVPPELGDPEEVFSINKQLLWIKRTRD